jgi:hypothetical protein
MAQCNAVLLLCSTAVSLVVVVGAKSLYINCEVSNFYGKEIEIWASFGPVDNAENKIGPIMSNFHAFMGKKKLNFLKNIVGSALKSCIK